MNRLLPLLLAFAACSAPKAPPVSPHSWAVVPVEQGSPLPDLLADELVRAGSSRVVRLEPVTDAAGALSSARPHKVDRILAVTIRRHDPYAPPRTTVAVEILRCDGAPAGSGGLDRLVSSASWSAAPLPLTNGTRRHALACFEVVVDARHPETRARLASYAENHRSPDGAFLAEGEYLAVQSRWMEFLAHVIVSRIPRE